MNRKQMMDDIIDAKIDSIYQGGDPETYLREAFRYGLPFDALVDMTDEQLLALLNEHTLSKEDV